MLHGVLPKKFPLKIVVLGLQIVLQDTGVDQRRGRLEFVRPQISLDVPRLRRRVVHDPQVVDNAIKGSKFLLHLLVMRSALVRCPCAYKIGHALEDFVHPSQMFVLEVPMVHLQKPVVLLLLDVIPVTHNLSWLQRPLGPLLWAGRCLPGLIRRRSHVGVALIVLGVGIGGLGLDISNKD